MAKPTLMERTRATVALVNSKHDPQDLELQGFMELFHPDVPKDKVREMVLDRKRTT
jgi:hypothetical protein